MREKKEILDKLENAFKEAHPVWNGLKAILREIIERFYGKPAGTYTLQLSKSDHAFLCHRSPQPLLYISPKLKEIGIKHSGLIIISDQSYLLQIEALEVA